MAVLKFGLMLRFTLLLMIVSCNGNEPQCSKFPFEEALLEKMIRMEIKVEQMEKGINEVKQQVKDEIVKLKELEIDVEAVTNNMVNESEQVLKLLEKTKENLTKNVNEAVSTEVNRMEVRANEHEGKLARMSEDVRELQNRTVQAIIDAVRVPHVSFAARAESDLAFSKNDRIVFEVVMANEDGSYDPATGKFTAPIPGIYLFAAQLCCSAGDPIEYAYMIDSILAQQARSYESTGHSCDTSIMIRRLEKGKRVWLENKNGNHLSKDSYKWNLFSGVLVSTVM